MSLTSALAALVAAMVAAAQVADPSGAAAAKAQRAPARTAVATLKAPQGQKAPPVKVKRVLYGTASWYGPGFHGRRTASGERFDRNRSTIASRGLPFGTQVRVTYMRTGKSAVAKVNDRGPFHRGRIIDCSEGLARQIGLRSHGSGPVKIEVLDRRTRR